MKGGACTRPQPQDENMKIRNLLQSERKLHNETGGVGNIYGNQSSDDISKANKRYFGDDGDKIHHSRYYHRYYEGYTEVRTENPGNKYVPYKTQRIYTAPYTVVDVQAPVYLFYKFAYAVLFVLAGMLYLSAMTDGEIPVNASKLAGVTVMVTLVPLFVLLVSLVGYYFRPKKMKLYDYRTSTRKLKYSAVASAAGCMVTVVAVLIYFAIMGFTTVAAEILYMLKLAGAAASCMGIYLMERELHYKQVENDVVLPKGEYHLIQ